MHVVVFGGGGAMGRITVRALAEDDRVSKVTIADRSLEAAQAAQAWLERGCEKAHAVACDVRDLDGTTALLRGASAVLNATDYVFNLEVMRAALEARVPYADLGGLFHMTRRQYELNDAFRAVGVTAVLGMGSTPGITNVLARHAVDALDRVERVDVRIGCVDLRPSRGFVAPYSMRTIFDECTLSPKIYRNGRWQDVAPLSGEEEIVFPAPVGTATALYTLHSEVALFPVSFRERGLRHASFKIAFPPHFLEQIKLLVQCGLASTEPLPVHSGRGGQKATIIPRDMFLAVLEAFGTPPSGPPNDCDVLRVEAYGTRDGTSVRLSEEVIVRPYLRWQVAAGDADTGIPLAIAGILLGSGEAALPGTHGAELVFDPQIVLRELARYDIHVTETCVRALS